jgi:hypothetical protein
MYVTTFGMHTTTEPKAPCASENRTSERGIEREDGQENDEAPITGESSAETSGRARLSAKEVELLEDAEEQIRLGAPRRISAWTIFYRKSWPFIATRVLLKTILVPRK